MYTLTFSVARGERGERRGFRRKNAQSILLRLVVAPTHLHIGRVSSTDLGNLHGIDTRLYTYPAPFADEDDSSCGGINHSPGPNSLRKTPTTYRKREFLSFLFVPTGVSFFCLPICNQPVIFAQKYHTKLYTIYYTGLRTSSNKKGVRTSYPKGS